MNDNLPYLEMPIAALRTSPDTHTGRIKSTI
jgi:hypothetical protein